MDLIQPNPLYSAWGRNMALSKKPIVDTYRAGLVSSGQDWSAEEIQFHNCQLKPRPATTPVTRSEVLARLFDGRGAGDAIDICQSHRGAKHEDERSRHLKLCPK